MDNELPPEQDASERAVLADLGKRVDQHEMKKAQHLEMLHEGHWVSYGGIDFELVGEEKVETIMLNLRSSDGIITSVPLEMLNEEGWKLVKK